MDIRLLKYYITICEEGSITRAAKKLNMSQPPLSKQIKQLEEEMGVILFIRGKKNIQLTQAGIFLKKRAEELVSAFDAIERQMSDYRNGNRGHIVIGAVEAVAANYLPDILTGFQKDYPEITYEIWSGSTDDILQKLDKGSIDIGFIRNPYDLSKYNSFELLQDSWNALIPEEHVLAGMAYASITPELLKEVPLIIPSTKGRVEELQTWFDNAAFQPHIICKYNVLTIGEALVRERMGIGLVLAKYTKASTPLGLVCKKLEPALESAVNVLWSKNHYLSEPASRFIEFHQR